MAYMTLLHYCGINSKKPLFNKCVSSLIRNCSPHPKADVNIFITVIRVHVFWLLSSVRPYSDIFLYILQSSKPKGEWWAGSSPMVKMRKAGPSDGKLYYQEILT